MSGLTDPELFIALLADTAERREQANLAKRLCYTWREFVSNMKGVKPRDRHHRRLNRIEPNPGARPMDNQETETVYSPGT